MKIVMGKLVNGKLWLTPVGEADMKPMRHLEKVNLVSAVGSLKPTTEAVYMDMPGKEAYLLVKENCEYEVLPGWKSYREKKVQ